MGAALSNRIVTVVTLERLPPDSKLRSWVPSPRLPGANVKLGPLAENVWAPRLELSWTVKGAPLGAFPQRSVTDGNKF